MKARKPDQAEVYKHRRAVRGQFAGRFRPPLRGVSDAVAVATVQTAHSARRAEKAWLRSLSTAEKRTLNGYRVLT